MLKQIFYRVVHLFGVTGDAWEITNSHFCNKERKTKGKREIEKGFVTRVCLPWSIAFSCKKWFLQNFND